MKKTFEYNYNDTKKKKKKKYKNIFLDSTKYSNNRELHTPNAVEKQGSSALLMAPVVMTYSQKLDKTSLDN